jgi:hypothetical protein
VQRLRELVRGFGYSIEYQMTGPKEPEQSQARLLLFRLVRRCRLASPALAGRGPRHVNNMIGRHRSRG